MAPRISVRHPGNRSHSGNVLSEEQLLDLLRERALDGNVAAISRLLEIERMRDPRSAAIAALERMTKGRQS